ncbi:histidine phosphatase family protein [Liquorilactobacillus sicerae]|uniref:histidine phosphatase family protein n=1 Tax=Liquorilactobacillus sicerae TaxID=1416943 RepID=UPI00248062B5|nr:histidine phosphatase family protein [Liquorilactobacillus sicerae]
MSFTVYFVRHGQTLLNKFRRMQGWCDSPLTEKGINDAISAGKHLQNLKFTNIYRSDMTRTARTCKYIIQASQHQLPQPKVLQNFREQGYGYFEGNDSGQTWFMVGAPYNCQSYRQLISKYSIKASRDLMKEADPFKVAENDQEFWQRINGGFEALRQNQQNGDQVLVVSHGTTIRSLVERFAPQINVIDESPENGSVTKMIIDENQVNVVYYNHYLDEQEY